MQTTSDIFMIRPVRFGFNEQTAGSNVFQDQRQQGEQVQRAALREFDRFAEVLIQNGLNVTVIEDTPDPHTPDSIFPNNWISTHDDGTIYLYPMEAENRRLERRSDIIDLLERKYLVREVRDLSYFEEKEKFLEGTGSMVLDRVNKVAYACISSRTDTEVLYEFASLSGYHVVSFHAFDSLGTPVYHTNVMMCIGSDFAAVCLEAVTESSEKDRLTDSLRSAGKEILEITQAQMASFAGNMLELKNTMGRSLLILSSQARRSLTADQESFLASYCHLIDSPLDAIETAGGGSARCMIAEIHLPPKEL